MAILSSTIALIGKLVFQYATIALPIADALIATALASGRHYDIWIV